MLSELILTPQKKQISLYRFNFSFNPSTYSLISLIMPLAFYSTSLLIAFSSALESVISFHKISFLKLLISLPANDLLTRSRLFSTYRGMSCSDRSGAIWIIKSIPYPVDLLCTQLNHTSLSISIETCLFFAIGQFCHITCWLARKIGCLSRLLNRASAEQGRLSVLVLPIWCLSYSWASIKCLNIPNGYLFRWYSWQTVFTRYDIRVDGAEQWFYPVYLRDWNELPQLNKISSADKHQSSSRYGVTE